MYELTTALRLLSCSSILGPSFSVMSFLGWPHTMNSYCANGVTAAQRKLGDLTILNKDCDVIDFKDLIQYCTMQSCTEIINSFFN